MRPERQRLTNSDREPALRNQIGEVRIDNVEILLHVVRTDDGARGRAHLLNRGDVDVELVGTDTQRGEQQGKQADVRNVAQARPGGR